jgi:hypothetical protein
VELADDNFHLKIKPLSRVTMSWGGIMGRKKVIKACMESPLYFTMPLRMRLEFLKGPQLVHSPHGLREDMLNWVKTGHFNSAARDKKASFIKR